MGSRRYIAEILIFRMYNIYMIKWNNCNFELRLHLSITQQVLN